MKYVRFGKSSLKVSVIGYGAWALGIKDWPGVDEKEALKTLEDCLACGITFFDTAPVYGFGRSEERLGAVLSSVRKEVIIGTKCGLRWDERGRVFHNLSRDSIVQEIEASLARLKTDYIDLYQIHWPDKKTPLEETMDTLKHLQRQGVIRHIGVSNFSVDILKQAVSLGEIACVQNLYNMLQREAEAEILPFCRKNDLGFICYSPLAQGILAGNFNDDFKPGRHDIRRLNPLFRTTKKLQQSILFARTLPGDPLLTALGFLVEQQGVSSILISMTQRKHLKKNLQAIGVSK